MIGTQLLQMALDFLNEFTRTLVKGFLFSYYLIVFFFKAVIPLNEECGLLEWVQNTHGLRNILTKIYKYVLVLSCFFVSTVFQLQSTPDNSNLQGKSKKVGVIGSSSYRELEENSRE